MDIHIRLAGVQLGPYSEKQIREYISEGLVSSEDLACEEGTDTWIPVTEILAKLPPAEGEPVAPPSMADAVFEDPEPREEVKPASDPVAGVTPPSRLPDGTPSTEPVEALAKRTLMIGPTPPVRRPGKGPTASSTVTTTPLANQGTAKISRSSIVKGFGAKTAPLPSRSTVPIGVPEDRPPSQTAAPTPATQVPSSAPPIPDGTTMPQKKGGMQAILQSLTAKTAPMRTAPPTPPSRNTLPITAPLPTRPINPPPHPPALSAAQVAPPPEKPSTKAPAPANAITEKMDRSLLPEAKPDAPSKSEPSTEATKSKPLEKFSRSGGKKKPEPEKPEEPAEEPAPRETSPKRKIPGLIFGCLCLAALAVYYVWSPYHAASAVRDALTGGTVADLNATVDFDAVRASLKSQVDAANPPSPKGTAILDHSIDLYVTPESISGLAGKTGAFSKDDVAQAISPTEAANLLQTFNSEPIRSSGLKSLTDFAMQTDVAILHLQFGGMEWKLKRIELRPDLQTPTANAPSPLIAPVVNTFLERGNQLETKNDWNGAINNFSQVLALDPNSSVAYNARAGARESAGDVDGAIKDFTKAIALNPQMADAFNGRGNARATKNDLDGAIADFTQAINLNPTLATAYDSRGNARTAKDDLDGAIADFSQAITIDPTLASAYSDRGFARQANGNLEGAISDYTQAINLKPKTANAYYNRGLARQSQGNLDAAIADYGRALAFDPKIAGAYYNRGNAKNAQHDIDGAIADFTQALAINPKNALAYCDRGLSRQSKGDLDGAVADYTQALTIDPKIAPAYYNRGLIRGQTNDPDGAIADASHSLDLDPKNNQALYNRAYAKLLKGNLDGAQADFAQFCGIAPRDHYADNARLYRWLISKAGPTKLDADQELTDALENNWNSPSDDLVTKTASFLLGRSSEAEYLASAASPDPKVDQGQHCETYYFAGMRRLLLGDKAAAVDLFQKSVATGQKDYCEYSLSQAELRGLQPPPPVAPMTEPVPAPAVAPAP